MSEYINRDALLKLIGTMPSSPTTKREERIIRSFISTVKNFPASDVCPYYISNKHDRGDDSLCSKAGCEVKAVRPMVRGKWIPIECIVGSLHINFPGCSVCKHTVRDKTSYCPNCGAEMRGAE